MGKKLTEILIEVLLIILAFLIGSIIIEKGIERNEKAECLNWDRQSKQYQLWFSSNWQREQCLRYNIKLK